MKKIVMLLLVLNMLITLPVMSIACSKRPNRSISNEARSYLVKMQSWKQQWDEVKLLGAAGAALEQLMTKLITEKDWAALEQYNTELESIEKDWSALEHLIAELEAIEPPMETIHYGIDTPYLDEYMKKQGIDLSPNPNEGDFSLYWEHNQYLEVLKTWVLANRNLDTVLAFLKVEWMEGMKDPSWQMMHSEWNEYYVSDPRYKDAIGLSSEAIGNYVLIEIQWDSVFSEYLK